MKKKIIKLGYNLFIPACSLFICYFIFNDELRLLPFINLIRYAILLLALFILISTSLAALNRPAREVSLPLLDEGGSKSIIHTLYLYSESIINYSFYIYFFLYLIMELDKRSIVYNYLLLLFFGVFLGYRIAIKAHYYLKEKVKN